MKKIVIAFGCLAVLIGLLIVLIINEKEEEKQTLFPNFIGEKKEEVVKYAEKNKLDITYEVEYNEEVLEGYVLKQSKKATSEIIKNEKIIITISKGAIPEELYREHGVDELGKVPILMYHGIHNRKNSDTPFVGGNVDVDGYQRTVEAFRKDLEFYYENGYRMIRLEDYIDGKIDVPLGLSPIILTFDDGIENNFLVEGLDENGELIIDSNSAIGILEEFKKKYPDFQVTATFFLNGGLFKQPEYNAKILEWLVNNGYDVGNHSWGHANLNNVNAETTIREIATMYQKLDEIIPNKYINVVALPFGNPVNNHSNFRHILNGTYQGYSYETVSTLRAGWESEASPYDSNFNRLFIKRIRAYDNNGKNFDIEYAFSVLKNNRYISDGDVNSIVIPDKKEEKIGENYDLNIRTY